MTDEKSGSSTPVIVTPSSAFPEFIGNLQMDNALIAAIKTDERLR